MEQGVGGGEVDDFTVDARWEARYILDGAEKAAHDRQIRRDARELTTVQLHEFEGPSWRRLEDRLVQYGLWVLPAKIRSGEIFKMMRELNVEMGADMRPLERSLTTDEVRELTSMLVGEAAVRYRTVLRDGRWTPDIDDGACLTSFFVGWCCWMFRGVWRRFLTQDKRRRADVRHLKLTEGVVENDQPAPIWSGPEAAVVTKLAFLDVIDLLDQERDRVIAARTLLGDTSTEVMQIFAHLDQPMTQKTVESRRRSIRARANAGRAGLREKTTAAA